MSSPVWMELPVELVLLIFVEAARTAVEGKASWITQLSLVSRATCHSVTPILYETLVISAKNLDLVTQLVEEERLMSYVRKVCIVSAGPSYPVDSPFFRALSRETIHTLDAPTWSTAKLMTHPRYLYLHNSTLCELPAGRSRLPFASVTHLSVAYEDRHPRRRKYGNGWYSRRRTRALILAQPSLDSSDSDDPTGPQQRRDPLYMALDALPALTHLSLDVGHQHTPLPGKDLRVFIFKILEACPRLHVFALHVMGDWDLVASLVAPVRDSRIRVWFDRRVPSSAGEELDWRIRDLRIGCNVWTQAEPLTDSWIDELSR